MYTLGFYSQKCTSRLVSRRSLGTLLRGTPVYVIVVAAVVVLVLVVFTVRIINIYPRIIYCNDIHHRHYPHHHHHLMSGILRRIDSALVEKDGEDASYIYTLIHTYTHIHTCPYMYKNIHTYSALPVPYQDRFILEWAPMHA